jgi:hypothetical protein
MIGKACAALGEQQLQAMRPVHERHEHCGGHRIAFAAGQAEAVAQTLRLGRRRPRQPLREPCALRVGSEVEQGKAGRRGHLQWADNRTATRRE